MRTVSSIGLYLISLFLTPFAYSALAQTSNPHRLPTGVMLDPAGERVTTGNMPLGMIFSPGGEKLIISLGGWREACD